MVYYKNKQNVYWGVIPVKTQLTKRKQQALETREKIFGAAVYLLKEKGFDHVSIGDICAAAEVSVGGFYHHFSSKEDIIVESFYNIDEHMKEAAEQPNITEKTAEKVEQYFRQMGQYVAFQGVDFTRQLIKSELSSEKPFTLSTERPIVILLEGIVSVGQKQGELCADMPAGDIARRLLRFARGIVFHWCVGGGNYDIEQELGSEVVRYLECFV